MPYLLGSKRNVPSHHTVSPPTRATWRYETITKITRYKVHLIDPYLLDILKDGILRYHRNQPLLPTTTYPAKYASLIIQQNLIGWDQLYRGRWSQEWAHMQDHYGANKEIHIRLSGDKWLLGLGRLMVDQWFIVWKLRNVDRHNRDNKRLEESRRDLIYQEIHHLYTYRLQVCPYDRHIFYESAASHLQHFPCLDTLEEWIHMYRPASDLCKCRAGTEAGCVPQ